MQRIIHNIRQRRGLAIQHSYYIIIAGWIWKYICHCPLQCQTDAGLGVAVQNITMSPAGGSGDLCVAIDNLSFMLPLVD